MLRFAIPGVTISSVRALCVACALVCLSIVGGAGGQDASGAWSPSIPKTWDDDALRSTELPLSRPDVSPAYVSSDYYYRMPIRPIYKSYPVYRPDREPPGYFSRLAQQEPEIVFDERTLRTEQAWTDAGRVVFSAPIEFESSGQLYSGVRDMHWYERNHVPVARDGVLPFMQYIVRQKGKVELGVLSCAMCHTRVLPDGTTITGAQGNFPDDHAFVYETRIEAEQARDSNAPLAELRRFVRRNYAAPWLALDQNAAAERMTLDEIASVFEAIVPGVCARQGSSPFFPPRIPDLIGVKDRRYLDASGLVRHRSIGDLMRYAALNQGADALSQYRNLPAEGRPARSGKGEPVQRRAALCAVALRLLADASQEPERVRCHCGARQGGVRAGGLRHVSHAAAVHEQHAHAGSRVHCAAGTSRDVTMSCARQSVPIPG